MEGATSSGDGRGLFVSVLIVMFCLVGSLVQRFLVQDSREGTGGVGSGIGNVSGMLN